MGPRRTALLVHDAAESHLTPTLTPTHASRAQVGRIIDPVSGPGATLRLQAIRGAHAHYCGQNLKNVKTRRMLEASFGEEWADKYLRRMMFDFEG